ncbi:MAG: family ATPase [Ilumatobacteraceae bacterium]|nr:family ATPase [Ilumatobacteraceae bacterium]
MQELVGRHAELSDARARIDRAVEGAGSSLILVGEAGIGKSSLLDAIADIADGRMQILRARGIEDEVGFSWSGITPIVRPLLAAVDEHQLAPMRRQMLMDVIAPVDGGGHEVSVELYPLCLALLDLVAAAAAERPVLLLVDDLHWIDRASALALGFVGRRLEHEYAALIATSRPSELDGSIPIATVASLTREQAVEVLLNHGVTSAVVRDALVDAVGTNPLLLQSSTRELSAEIRRGSKPLPDPIHFPATVMEGASRRIAELPEQTREALAAVAVLGTASPIEVSRLLDLLDSELTCLEAAECADVVDIGDTIRFTHPTLRTAAYRSAPPPELRRLHGVAATIAHDPITIAMHLAASTIGPDELIAAEVEAAAERLTRRGAAAVAAAQYVRAAQLSPVGEDASRRRLLGAGLFLDLGLIDEAESLLADLPQGDVDVAMAHARARLLHLQERDDAGCLLLRSTAERVAAFDPDGAARLLVECLAPMVREGRLLEVLDLVAQLERVRPQLTGIEARRATAVLAVFSLVSGGTIADAMASIDVLIRTDGVPAAAPFIAEVIAPILAYANRGDELGALLDSVERNLRDRAAIVPLISVLAAQQLHNFGSDQPRSIGAGEEAIQLADEIGRPKLAMMAAIGLSIGAAIAGDAVAHHRAATLLQSSSYPHAEAARLTGLGVLHLTSGRPEEALLAWEALIRCRGFGDPLLTFEADYIETLIRLGRLDEARSMLNRFDSDGLVQRSPGILGRVVAMLTPDDEVAGAQFMAAIEACRLNRNQVGEGRAELAWGERLRRKRRRAEARVHLHRAADLFHHVGLACWEARVETELQAAGVPTDTSLPVHAILTSQELRVARLVAAGASNRDIGLDLFVSQRTVETHLTTIFRKLGAKNRRELAARAVDDVDLRRQANVP